MTQFCKTERFIGLMNSVLSYNQEEEEDAVAAKSAGLTIAPPNKTSEDLGRAYLTVSQAANEKQAATAK